MQYIGLDVHKQFIVATTLTAAGQVAREERLPTTRTALEAFAQRLSPDDALALESTTNAWPVYHLLAASGGRVVVSNPLQTKAIASAKIKTDKVDSRVLAELLRADYLPLVWVPDPATQARRQLCSYRQALVRQRTQVKNRLHALLHRNLVPLPPFSDLFGRRGQAFLQEIALPPLERFQADQELVLLEVLDLQVAELDHQLAQAAVDSPELRLLLTLPGFSLQVGMGVLAAIGDIQRFPQPKRLVSYLGLDPLGRCSADRHLGPTCISKRGRSHARWLLVEAATAAVRSPGPLAAFYLRLRVKKGHSKAIVAVARKLACLAWQLLTSGEPYLWAPPLHTAEKLRRVELLAGQPKRKPGAKPGQPSAGGRPAYLARRRSDQDLAKLAQAQYEQLVELRAQVREGS